MSRASNLAGFTTSITSTRNLNIGIVTASEYDIFGSSNTLTVGGLSVGVSTFSGIATHTAALFGTQASFTGIVTASGFRGDGSNLTGVSAGLALRQAGSVIAGGAATTVNFASGATITPVSSGIATITISAGLTTEAANPGVSTVITLNLTKQDHRVTATGITTITVSGGIEGESHTVRIVNSGIATVGFSTFFLFPSGSPPSLPTTSGAIHLVSFTVHRVGTAGTQLLAGASLNFS